MPNKTIYVADDDLPLLQQAQELAGGSMSAAIAAALRRYVEVEKDQREGYGEVVLKVGRGLGQYKRFVGALVGEWQNTRGETAENCRVYRTRNGKYVIYTVRGKNYWQSGGWRAHLGMGTLSWGFVPDDATIDIYDSLEAMQAVVPKQLYELVRAAVEEPAVEDLDI